MSEDKNIKNELNENTDILADYHSMFLPEYLQVDGPSQVLTVLNIDEIKPFPNHPFYVIDDEAMEKLAESIKTVGMIHPVFVRKLEEGGYEMISGHRRKRACELNGIKEIQARVFDITRDEATVLLVDSNLQRDRILPSEKAFAYKMKMDALKRQGMRTDLTSCPVGTKLRSDEKLAESVKDSARQIQRYVRLTELVPDLLDKVDKEEIAMRPAVELSYLSPEEQLSVCDSLENYAIKPSHVQTILMRKLHNEGKLDSDKIDEILSEDKPNQAEKLVIKDPEIISKVPGKSPSEQVAFVVKAIEFYSNFLAEKEKKDKAVSARVRDDYIR